MQRKKIVIVGAGGLGREVMWQLTRVNDRTNMYEILGYVDDTVSLQNQTINGYPVVGNIQWLTNYQSEICAVVCIGNAQARKKVVSILYSNYNIYFPTIIAEDAKYSDTVTFGKGCIVGLSNIITVNVSLGDFVIANVDCTIGHDAVIDDYVTLYPSVNVSGNIHIGSCSEIGTGTNIIQKKNIGKNVIIGAGSVVIKDIPDNCTAVGVPARPLKFHDKNEIV